MFNLSQQAKSTTRLFSQGRKSSPDAWKGSCLSLILFGYSNPVAGFPILQILTFIADIMPSCC